MILLILFFEFFKIGLFAFGGGLAALPFLQQLINRYGWITADQLLNMIAISESTPGPIGVNVATFVGFRTAGIIGGLVATLGVALPSLLIIMLVAGWLKRSRQHPLVQGAFQGIRPAVAGLIGAVALDFGRKDLLNIDVNAAGGLLGSINWPSVLLLVVILLFIGRFKSHPVVILASAAAIGILFQF